VGDMGEVFREGRLHSIMKRAANREQSAQILKRAEVAFQTKNNGAHLIVAHEGKTVDFYPGTGAWKDRTGAEGRGVFKLLKHLGVGRE